MSMNIRITLRAALVAACIATFGLGSAAALAHGFGGGHAAGVRGGYGYAFGGYRPAYGYRGGYRGGYYGYWGAFGLGLFVASLPYYYSTYWWDGVPYYYADNIYYRYNDNVREYEKVTPPAGLRNQGTTATSESSELFAYPRNGQTDEQQAKDKVECKRWASTQNGLDAPASSGTQPDAAKRTDYLRAQTACLEGRGYTVK
jgi:hypothetical protein